MEIRPSFTYEPPHISLLRYQKPFDSIEIIVESIITDNEAFSVQSTLARLGIDTEIKKFVHWEITYSGEQESIKNRILDTGELFNPNKEREVVETAETVSGPISFLIRYHDDIIGARMKQTLKKQYAIKNIDAMRRGALWVISARHDSLSDLAGKILETHILFNQYSQECFMY